MFDLQTTSAAAYRVTVDGDDFRYADSNEACRQMTSISVQSHPGVRPQDLFAPAVAEEVLSRYRACVRTSQAVSYVSEIVYLEGRRRWRTTLLPVVDGTGRVHAIVGICSAAEAEDHGTLSLTDKASLALGAIDGGFWIYELADGSFWIYELADGSFETSRPLAEMLAGPGVATLNLAEYLSHVHSEDLSGPSVLNPSMDRSIVEYRVVAYDGRTRWLKSRRRVIRDEAGMPVRVVGLVSDVTEQRHALEALETEATTLASR